MRLEKLVTTGLKTSLIIMTAFACLFGCGQKENESEAAADANIVAEASGEVSDTGSSDDANIGEETENSPVDHENSENPNQEAGSEIIDGLQPAYKDVLDKLYLALSEGPVDGEYPEGTEDVVTTGIMELGLGAQPGDGLSEIGYTLRDLNNDGKEELIIGEYPQGGTYIPGNSIYAVYSDDNGKAELLLEGWARNRWYLLDENILYNEGSGGAMYTIVGKYTVAADGKNLDTVEYYFTDYADETQETIGVFTNPNGEWDTSKSTLSEMTDADLWVMMETCENNSLSLDLTSLYDYGNPLAVCNDAEYTGDKSLINWVSLDSSEYQAHMVCVAKEDIKSIKIYALTCNEFDDQGMPVFEREEVYTQDKLSKDSPLGLDLSIGEVIPTYSIAFSTSDGKEYEYALEESGEDGKALLLPIQ